MSTSFLSIEADSRAGSLGSNRVSVRITKPSELGLADWMSLLRGLCDRHRIEPTGFKCGHRSLGLQTYEMTFPDKNQAELFSVEFNKTHLQT